MKFRFGALIWLVLTASVASVATAQEQVTSPHGDLSEPCATCHTAEGWSPAKAGPDFDHSRYGMRLEGAHASLDCLDCHRDLAFSATGADCVDCHLDVHEGELGVECDRCHGVRSFVNVADQRRMHRLSRFPLTGTHAATDCEACHPPLGAGELQWLGTPADCWSCHRAEFEATTDPNHVNDGFLEQCEYCHGTVTWAGGFFNHDRQLAGLSTVCVDCHRDEYDATNDPDHETAGFPTDCNACHGTRTWDDARFDHDSQWFPIYGGRHAEEWDTCSRCHTDSANYMVYTCLSCHPHSDQGETANQHDEEGDYVYESTACYECHPRGRAEDD